MHSGSQKDNGHLKAVVGGKLIDGTGMAPIEDAVVIIEGDCIRSVGQADATPIPTGAKLIDVTGKTLVPGLINCHAHLCLDGSPDPFRTVQQRSITENVLLAARHAEASLHAGVTTLRDLGGWEFVDLGLKKAINDGLILGPRMLASGKPLCMTGGTAHLIGREVDGPDEARKGAREQLKAGADVIKVMATGGVLTVGTDPGSAQLTYEELRAAVEEAKKASRLVAAHAHGATGIKNAIRAGTDSIEHGFFLDAEAIDMMLEQGTFYVPTLAATHEIITKGPEFGMPASMIAKAQRAGDAHIDSFRRAWQAGVRIAAGNDGGTPFNRADNLAGELERMVAAGMSCVEALATAHRTAAELLGMAEQIGTVEPGKLADLVVLDADPQVDISATRQVHMVIKAGQRVSARP
jgi:imidazolonepropionase-like amidohydrolase